MDTFIYVYIFTPVVIDIQMVYMCMLFTYMSKGNKSTSSPMILVSDQAGASH